MTTKKDVISQVNYLNTKLKSLGINRQYVLETMQGGYYQVYSFDHGSYYHSSHSGWMIGKVIIAHLEGIIVGLDISNELSPMK